MTVKICYAGSDNTAYDCHDFSQRNHGSLLNELRWSHLKAVRTKHLVGIAKGFLQTAFPLLLGVDNDGLRDAVQAFFCPDGVYVELHTREKDNQKQAGFTNSR